MLSQLYKNVRSLFLHGFFTLFPLAATIFIVHFSYTLVASWLAPLQRLIPQWLACVPGAEFFIVIVGIFCIGAVLKFFIMLPVIHRIERFIKQIPIIRIVYSSSKILVDFFNVPNPATSEQKVVLIEFPRPGYYNIAFLLESAENTFQKLLPDTDRRYYKVFMPTAPNPTSGFFLIVSSDKIIDTQISFEEAIKTVVSCGIHTPESLNPFPPRADFE